MSESEVAAMSRNINGTAAQTSFQDSKSYVTFLFLKWCIVSISKELQRLLIKYLSILVFWSLMIGDEIA